jgi:pyruvate formate lyase activating enzyme
MKIGGLQKTTLVDYPGRVAATVFLAGCNFRCPFCYSSELVLPEKIKEQPEFSREYFFNFLSERQGLLEGIVICGGEPTVHLELPEFARKIKSFGYFLKLDTNGSNPQMVKELLEENILDYVAMDIKVPLERYPELVEKESKKDIAEKIKETVGILKSSKIDYEFRTTVVPQFLNKEDMVKIAKWIGGEKEKYYLQNFRAEKTLDPEFVKRKPYPDQYLIEIKNAVSPFFKICQIR